MGGSSSSSSSWWWYPGCWFVPLAREVGSAGVTMASLCQGEVGGTWSPCQEANPAGPRAISPWCRSWFGWTADGAKGWRGGSWVRRSVTPNVLPAPHPPASPAFLTNVSPFRSFSACPCAGTTDSPAMAPLQHGIHDSAGNWGLCRDKGWSGKGLFWQEWYLTAVKCTDLE